MRSNGSQRVCKAIAIAMAFLFPLLVAAQKPGASENEAVKAAESHIIYFTLVDEFGFPSSESIQAFDCTDKIYTVVELADYPVGKYDLSILWIDPAGNSREHTRYVFQVRGENTRLWAWLSLSRATGAGLLQWMNPAAGLEEFIGPWTVEVRVDKEKIASQNFDVSC